jgi:hypothetical protein
MYVRRSREIFSVEETLLYSRVAAHPKRITVQCYYGIPLFGSEGELLATCPECRQTARPSSFHVPLRPARCRADYLQPWFLPRCELRHFGSSTELRGHGFRDMQCGVGRIRVFDDLLRLGYFCGRPCVDQQKLICGERRLVLHNAVLGDTYAKGTGSQSTQCSHFYGTFQSCHDPRHHRSGH